MLPAWATVALALGASLIGALAGVAGSWLTFKSAQIDIAHQRQEAWRTRLIEAADGFACLYAEMGARLSEVPSDVDEFEKQVVRDGAAVSAASVRVVLLFGPSSTPSRAALGTLSRSRACGDKVIEYRRAGVGEEKDSGLEEARELQKEADRFYNELLESAHASVSAAS